MSVIVVYKTTKFDIVIYFLSKLHHYFGKFAICEAKVSKDQQAPQNQAKL